MLTPVALAIQKALTVTKALTITKAATPSSALTIARALSADGGSIGGVEIGAAGTGIYSGYVLSGGDDFAALNLISATNPNGRYGTARAYSNGGMRSPESGPLAVMYDASPDHTGWNDSNRGVPIGFDTHTIVPGEGSGALRLTARRQTAPEQALLNTSVAGQIELGAMIHGAADFWVQRPAIIAVRARLPAGLYGQHPTIWMLSAYPPGGPSFTGNEYGWEGGRTENEPYHNGHVSGSVTQNHGAKSPTYRDGNFHTFTVKAETDYQFRADGTLQYTAAVDPNANGNKPDYLIVSNHVYNALFEGQTYDAADWLANPAGCSIDIEWVQYWRPAGASHYNPLIPVTDVFVTAGAALNIALPSQSALWGATGLTELVTAVALEREQPGITSNTATFGLMPSGISYDGGTRVISGTVPSQAGHLLFAAGVTGDGNTCKPARFNVFVAPIWSGSSSFSWTNGVPVSYDVYANWSIGRLFQAGANPKGLSVSGLPTGLSFSSSTGLITGTPTVDSSGSLTISCTNSAGQTTITSPTFAVSTPAGIAAPVLTGGAVPVASWDFGDPGKITASAGSIDSIAGSDGTSYALTNTGANRPTTTTTGGKGAANFSAASTQTLGIASGLGLGSAGATIVAIVEPDAGNVAQVILDIANGSATAAFSRMMLSGSSGGTGWSMRKADATQTSDISQGSAYGTGRQLLIGVSQAGTSASRLGVNGQGTFLTGVNGSAQNPTGLTHTTMGGRRVSGSVSLPLSGKVLRVLVYASPLNATNWEEIAVWAAANYGTTNGA